jgi:hypothetical protein
VLPRAGGAVLLRVHHSRSSQNPMCSGDAARPVMPYEQALMPTLVAPQGARQNGGGGGGGNETWESSARLETPWAAAHLLAHYAAQIREQGWGAAEEAHAGPVSVQAFSMSDEKLGNVWGVLTIVALPSSGSRFASFRLGREGGRTP